MNTKLIAAAVALGVVAGANATLYVDNTGDIALGSMPHMDITSVDVTSTATQITFQINLAGDPIATNWGKYNVILHNLAAGTTDTSLENNPWGRNYRLLGGSTGFIGSWADQPANNQQNWSYNGSWNMNLLSTNAITTSTVTLTANLADLGLGQSDSIIFDVVTTGGGDDTAVDSLTGVPPTSWGEQVALEGLLYNPVPEPATMAVLGLGAAALLRRRAKK